MSDLAVFGPYRGGTFQSFQQGGGLSEGPWCECERHRVEDEGAVCPVCRSGEAR